MWVPVERSNIHSAHCIPIIPVTSCILKCQHLCFLNHIFSFARWRWARCILLLTNGPADHVHLCSRKLDSGGYCTAKLTAASARSSKRDKLSSNCLLSSARLEVIFLARKLYTHFLLALAVFCFWWLMLLFYGPWWKVILIFSSSSVNSSAWKRGNAERDITAAQEYTLLFHFFVHELVRTIWGYENYALRVRLIDG